MPTPLHRLQRRNERNSARDRGQSLVEFSLMMVFLVVLLMGVLDLGRAYFTYLALKDAAAEGAYFASAFPECIDESGVPLGCGPDHNVPYRVEHSAVRGGLIDWTNANISITRPALAAGQVLTVTVTYNYQLITPFAGTIANGQVLTLTAASAATIIRVPNCTGAVCQ